MKEIKTGFLLGIGAYMAFQVLGLLFGMVFVLIGIILNTFMGMAV